MPAASARVLHARRVSAIAPAGAREIAAWRVRIAALCALPALFYAMLFPLLRPLGELPLLAAVLGAAVSAAALGRLIMPLAQALLAGFAVIWLGLSLARALPTSWTVYYDAGAAVRQWAWVLIMPLFTTAFYALFLHFGRFIWRRALLLAAIWYALSRIGLVLSNEPNWSWDIVLYGVNNINIPIFILLYIFVLTRPHPLLLDLTVTGAIASVCATITNLLSTLGAAAVRLSSSYKLFPAILGLMLMAMLLTAPQFPLDIYRLDGNSGVRAVMWRDATQAFVDTRGLGVGFGTEYITNRWGSIVQNWTLIGERDAGRMFISTHSAFYDILLRQGAIGGALFLLWMGRYACIPGRLTTANGRTAAALAMLLFCSLSFNPGTTSVNIYVGVAMLIGVLEMLRAGVDHVQPAPPPAPRLWRLARQRMRSAPSA